MTEPAYRIETHIHGYRVHVGPESRIISPLKDGQWFVLGWVGDYFPSKAAAANAVVAHFAKKATP